MAFNLFRVTADLAHLASIIILIVTIHKRKSTDGISFLTQALYLLVFFTRYTDILTFSSGWHALWNLSFKVVFIVSSIYILYLMKRAFPSGLPESRLAYTLALASCGSSAVLALMVAWWKMVLTDLGEILWIFSIILESTCVLPQLALLRQTDSPTVIDSYYLVALGSYRALYLLNWLVKWINYESIDGLTVVFGLIQTILYLDFAYVYYRRAQVKLRPGLIDLDDLRQGFLIHKVFGGEEEEIEVQVLAEERAT